jgi:hypothetical protein
MKQYLIAKLSVTSENVFQASARYGWTWINEIRQTEEHPYELIFGSADLGAYLHYLEEDKDIFWAHYFVVKGDDIDSILTQMRSSLDIYESQELLQSFHSAQSSRERGAIVYQLGIIAPKNFDQEFFEVSKAAFLSEDPNVRIAAIWGSGWIDWPEIKTLVEEAALDTNADVKRAASIMIEAYEYEAAQGSNAQNNAEI